MIKCKKRFIITFLITALLLLPSSLYAVAVFVNDEEVELENPPINENGRLLVPFTQIFKALGVTEINWYEAEKKVEAKKNNTSIQLTIGSTNALKNGIKIILEVPPTIYNDRTYVPLRFVAEALGAQVVWDPTNQEVQIKSKVLEKREIIANRVEVLIPQKFSIMSEEIAKLKYPSEQRPTIIFTNEDASINIAFNYTQNEVSDEQISEVVDSIGKSFENLYPSATWYEKKVITIGGKNVGIIELLTSAIDTNIYNLIFFFELDERLMIGTFNCVEKEMEEYKPIAWSIVQSLEIK